MTHQNKRITAPTLRIWGTQDGALEKKLAELSGNYFTDHTVDYIPTAGHWCMLDEPNIVNSCIENFLSGKKRE